MHLIPRGLEWNSDNCGRCSLLRKYLILKYKVSIDLIRKYLATCPFMRIRVSGLPWTVARHRVPFAEISKISVVFQDRAPLCERSFVPEKRRGSSAWADDPLLSQV